MSTNTHNHRGSDVSAVAYLSVPKGSGTIAFWPNPLDDYRSVSYSHLRAHETDS